MESLKTKNNLSGGYDQERGGYEEPVRLLPGVTIEALPAESIEEIYPDRGGQLKIPHYGLPTERQFVNH